MVFSIVMTFVVFLFVFYMARNRTNGILKIIGSLVLGYSCVLLCWYFISTYEARIFGLSRRGTFSFVTLVMVALFFLYSWIDVILINKKSEKINQYPKNKVSKSILLISSGMLLVQLILRIVAIIISYKVFKMVGGDKYSFFEHAFLAEWFFVSIIGLLAVCCVFIGYLGKKNYKLWILLVATVIIIGIAYLYMLLYYEYLGIVNEPMLMIISLLPEIILLLLLIKAIVQVSKRNKRI